MHTGQLTFLLIHPEISRTKYNFVGVIENECLELEYIQAVLQKKGHTVYLYDGQVEEIPVSKALQRYTPDVVYVCGRTRQENFILEYCETAKRFDPNILTIIGGLHAQLCYERMYRDFVDYILTSYEITTIFDMVDFSIFHKPVDLSTCNGICYQDNHKWFHTEAKPCDIRKLPRPDRSYFYSHPDRYRYLELTHAAWVRTAYSCPFRCSFCHRNRMNASTYSARDIEDVVDEIASIPDENIYLVDDDFLFDEKRVERFIQLNKEKKLQKKYICYGRSDFIAEHEALMADLKEIGLYYVLVGLEAIDERHLKDYNKRSDTYNNEKSIEICHHLGIHLMGMFILDLDYTASDFHRLYQWCRQKKLSHVALSIFTPELGLSSSKAYEDRLITQNPSHYDYLHLVAKPTRLSVKRYYLYYYLLLIRFFLRAKREGIYDFIDYGDYIHSFLTNLHQKKRSHDDE